ncbi:hypothetical protein NH340_JMT05823 [Sarcoptes scabiei]|nr:hypothetical protein NH340_JMT05823 [Sarcoptes scabiei]
MLCELLENPTISVVNNFETEEIRKMEKKLVKLSKEIMSNEKALGFVLSDSDGLSITANGVGDKNITSSLLKLVQAAEKLDESHKESMAIRIDCKDHCIDVKHHRNLITAFYREY